MNAGESLRDQVERMLSVRTRKHGPGAKNRRDGAPEGAAARKSRALKNGCAARRAIPSRMPGLPDRRQEKWTMDYGAPGADQITRARKRARMKTGVNALLQYGRWRAS